MNVDATSMPLGQALLVTNNNVLGWNFKASTNEAPFVESVDGTKALSFYGTNYLTGIGEPEWLAGNAARSVVAWVYNPAVGDEETVAAWGRRGGNPDGSNSAYSYGRNATYGAQQYWGSFDTPWGTNATQIVSNTPAGKWTFVSYVYDPATTNKITYKDGVVATSIFGPGPLVTPLYDPSDPLNIM